MTDYILAGGNDKENKDYGTKLAKTVGELTNASRPLRIVSCPFAADPGDWVEKNAERREWFSQYFSGDEVGYATPDAFIDQLERADVVYLHGGAAKTLLDVMATLPDLEPHFKDKVVVGSSAGADYLSTAFYSCVGRRAMRGYGIVSNIIMPHYGSTHFDDDAAGVLDWAAAEDELSRLVNGRPITRIREGEFIVVSKP